MSRLTKQLTQQWRNKMTTEREEFESWFIAEFGYGDDYAHVDGMVLAWQARGKKDAELIEELESRLKHEATRIKALELGGSELKASLDKSRLQVQVLRDTVEEIAYAMETKAINNTVVKDTTVEAFAKELKEAISTTPNTTEWIRRSKLENVASVCEGRFGNDSVVFETPCPIYGTPLYRIRGNKHD